MANTLALVVKSVYFHQIKELTKGEEYRLDSPYWRQRIEGKSFDRIVITWGYPKKENKERRLTRPWQGYTKKTICHPHFGDRPVRVFAIKVNP